MSDTATAQPSGLLVAGTDTHPVPLTGLSIRADLHAFYARVVVTQRYVNRERTPIEAVYVFPLDEGSAVCGFEAMVDGTLVVGEVHEREKAFERYDDAMAAGHGAFLLDEERPDVFRASIGNLPPGKDVIVRLTYVSELPVDEGRLRFVIPTTVAPRYAPAEDRIAVGQPDSEALNPPVAFRVPYGLDLSVRIAWPSALRRVESPSHPISLQLGDGEATVTLAQADAALDRDFVLSIDATGLDTPLAMAERTDDGVEALGIAFAPSFAAGTSPAEVVFLVDRSGSMEGESIESVRNALQTCLRSMTAGCRFNIVGFGSTYAPLFPESRPYDQSSLDAATAHVATMDADLGGTELLPALQFVLSAPAAPELPKQVVVLTDGEVTNTDAVMALAASHAKETRVFTFGIGAGASHHLVRGLARAGRGTAEFIHPGERIERKIVRQFARLLAPAVTDVKVEWVGGDVTQAPQSVPPVFAGGRVLVYAFVTGRRPSLVRLTARERGGTLSFEVPVPESERRDQRTISTLAARARIRELEEGSEWLTARGSQQRERKSSAASKEIIDLSVRFGLISRETSFVALEKRDTPVIGDVKLRRIPIALTSGWGGLPRSVAPRMALSTLAADIAWNASITAPPARAMQKRQYLGAPPSGGAPRRLLQRALGTARWRGTPPSVPRGAGPAPASLADVLIVLQAADGSWALTEELAAVVGHELRDLQSVAATAHGPADEAERAWATSLAIAWLEMHAASRSDEWRLLADKARAFVSRCTARPQPPASWGDIASQFLSDSKVL